MRSIIDEIAQAEAEADRIRSEAALNAKEIIQRAHRQSEENDKVFEQEERESLRDALNNAEIKGAELAKDISVSAKAAAEQVCEKAAAKLPGAVDYIVGKVREFV